MRRVVIDRAPRAPAAMHRHEARLVVFLRGRMRERSIEGRAVFEAGDFVFRPHHFAHASEAQTDEVAYTHLQVPAQLVRRWVSCHGWRCGRGRVQLPEPGDAQSLLGVAKPEVFQPPALHGPIWSVADALAAPHSRSVAVLAEEAGFAPHQLTRQFLAAHGMTPTSYRRQARLQRALSMLAEGSASLIGIAQDCGFHDQAHMNREVRQETGLTPGAVFATYRG